ncbi:low molecular weight phosphatase family protein [Elizabethkingia anophelis]|uniref:arsenate-mycothiol transferase ArsC n=1 Tax=Elizabethkingia anophelis TaxID=1117645 RepID=UPI0008401C69|nr:protein-tyrosine-phosphatase [Elizabethkingia anophelis]MCT3662770.1 protein-tyrosine-phosphatase [Elizabethkingia anophelis]MCT3800884.1 protein-tyrosine-phosphatase [Elizabethkingia anophelis]MCT3905847.1 protein-tyrosine-phosphatase [Elizabethkingia anophelis]MCT3919070.1 protein-tyrosine-phosphatase [Elizabethkingia anophelis]MCT3951425.1 protein-tyrosine-phosphatase [Elizabethkingia anophelis]
MYQSLFENIQGIQKAFDINEERKNVLWPLIGYIQKKINDKKRININFICTHNSRRSHLSQIWAQAAASYFNIPGVHCYSGGTEETALFPKIIETLKVQGFNILKISDGNNPVYAIKYSANTPPVIGFSKKYDNPFNPEDSYAAVMTCSQADEGCPFIAGAEVRIPITFEDPKKSDNTPEQTQVYAERSLQIAAEMLYVFSSIKI